MRPRKLNRYRQPFWMPASTYYFLSSAVAIGTFFLVWAILNDSREESPWIPAGLIASGILISSGALREIFLRGRRNRALIEQRRLDRALMSVPIPATKANPDKLTLERNAAFLNEIQRKSDAAKVLSSIPASHREVFELCEEYIETVDRELPTVSVGSPRLRPLTKGRDFALRFHRYHMLRWAEGEAVSFAQSAAATVDPVQRLENAAHALSAIETAATRYPEERKLEESSVAIREVIASLRAKVLIDKAKNEKLIGSREDLRSILDEAESAIAEGEVLGRGGNAVFESLRNEIAHLRTGDAEDLP
jgi:hypothetical protein